MLKLVSTTPNPPKFVGGDRTPPKLAKCPHGYVLLGNCVRCTPPPAYKAMRGNGNTSR
jgi:hypothetical protein